MGCRCCGGTFLAARASLQGAPFRGAALAGGEFALQPLCSLMDPAEVLSEKPPGALPELPHC